MAEHGPFQFTALLASLWLNALHDFDELLDFINHAEQTLQARVSKTRGTG
jgi:hypothetical protein